MSKKKYIGLENELTSFYNGESRDIEKYILCKRDLNLSKEGIQKNIGNAFYVDGYELEILTPPIAINRGFATRLTDSLLIGRDYFLEKIMQINPELVHTGYSMHWNLTNSNTKLRKQDYLNFYNPIIIPFNLFALTPLSRGLRLREKLKPNFLGRWELLGDSLKNEEQIKANALILGAYLWANSSKLFDMPITINQIKEEDLPQEKETYYYEGTKVLNKLAFNGRDSLLRVIYKKKEKEISAQDYLEQFYKWIKPFVLELGTKEEIKNLEDFISGKKRLEIDEKEYFNYLFNNDGYEIVKGKYFPIKTPFIGKEEGQELKPTGKNIEIPLENILSGELIKYIKGSPYSRWEYLIEYDSEHTIGGIKNLYNFVRKYDKKLPVFISPTDLSKLQKSSKE